jgi:hypothetical protein
VEEEQTKATANAIRRADTRSRVVIAQAAIPPTFRNRWYVGGVPWEGELNAGRECEVLGYMQDERGCALCHVRFLDMPDLFADREGYFTPWALFPVLERAA